MKRISSWVAGCFGRIRAWGTVVAMTVLLALIPGCRGCNDTGGGGGSGASAPASVTSPVTSPTISTTTSSTTILGIWRATESSDSAMNQQLLAGNGMLLGLTETSLTMILTAPGREMHFDTTEGEIVSRDGKTYFKGKGESDEFLLALVDKDSLTLSSFDKGRLLTITMTFKRVPPAEADMVRGEIGKIVVMKQHIPANEENAIAAPGFRYGALDSRGD